MSIISIMTVRVAADQREAAVRAFEARQVLPECAQAIPGFLHGELALDLDDDETLRVIAHWQDRAAYDAWVAHPKRDAQAQDLSHFLLAAPVNQVMRSFTRFPLKHNKA